MKNIFSLLIMISLSFGMEAQVNKVYTMDSSATTITGTQSKFVVARVQQYAKSVSIQAKVTKVGGTIANTGLLSGSNDGVNFVNIGIDTMKCTDVTTNTKIWVLDGASYEYYKVTFLGVGTDTFKIYGYVLPQQVSGLVNSVVSMRSTYALTKDTVTNGATNSLIIRVQQWYERTSIQAVVTKISGTVAGTVTLQGSNDGLNFVTVNTGYLINDVTTAPFTTAGTATLTALNQTTTTKIFVIRGSPYEYYRLSYTGTGTMVATLKGYVLANK